MKVLAIIDLAMGVEPREALSRLDEELLGSWRLFGSDVLRETYATEDPRRVVFVLEAADLKVAEDALATLPLVKLGLFTVQLTELRPFANWSRLFSQRNRDALAKR